MPVGQADGGRDVVQKGIVYQVKWTAKPAQNPAAWVRKAIKSEQENIRRAASNGVARYFFMTSVQGSATPSTGDIDAIDAELVAASADLGMEMQCLWRPDIDAWVDAAPDSLKWSYANMLAGIDLFRYLLGSTEVDADSSSSRLRRVVRAVAAKQFDDDSKVNLKQAELRGDLESLFIDVEGALVNEAPVAPGRVGNPIGATGAYLLSSRGPLACVVRGQPGQGKTTLGQAICQVHRARLLKFPLREGTLPELPRDSTERVAVRIDLRDLDAWSAGGDPLTSGTPRPRRTRTKWTIEGFLAYLMRSTSGGLDFSVEDVRDMLDRSPCLIVFDGLDEVGNLERRAAIVKQLDDFIARGAAADVLPQIIVTTRPSASELPEPTSRAIRRIELRNLSDPLQWAYVDKWSAARGLTAREAEELKANFVTNVDKPYVARLADNPLQLSILLHLLHRKGQSVPESQARLYALYLGIFLDREATKSEIIRDSREVVEEVTAYLGWIFHSQAETGQSTLRTRLQIKKLIHGYLYAAKKGEVPVEELFTAVTDRVWVLTSKVQPYFQFDNQPIREYFAAKFLFDWAGTGSGEVSHSDVLAELLIRAFWSNVARFFAGFAGPNEISGLVEGIEEAIESGIQPAQARQSSMNLVIDGAFRARTRTEERAVGSVVDWMSGRLLGTLIPPDELISPKMRDRLAERLFALIDADPRRGALLAQGLRHLGPARRLLDGWLRQRLLDAGEADAQSLWLEIGARLAGLVSLPLGVEDHLLLNTPQAARSAIALGVRLPDGSDGADRVLQFVLDGRCTDTVPAGGSLGADLLAVLGTPRYISRMAGGGAETSPVAPSVRAAAQQRLQLRPGLENLSRMFRPRAGETGSVAPIVNAATALAAQFGPCWLSAELAILAVASREDLRGGGDLRQGSEILGADVDYGRLVQQARANRHRVDWWNEQFDRYQDPLSRGTLALGLAASADVHVLSPLQPLLNEVLDGLEENLWGALCETSGRFGRAAIGSFVPPDSVSWDSAGSRLSEVLSHRCAPRNALRYDIPQLSDELLAKLMTSEASAWLAVHALSSRALSTDAARFYDALAQGYTEQLGPSLLDGVRLTDRACDEVLRRATSIQSEWLEAASAREARRSLIRPLADVAAEGHWFEVDE